MQFAFKRHHNGPGLGGLCSAFHLKIDLRFWNTQLVKKGIAEVFVIVLTGMNQPIGNL